MLHYTPYFTKMHTNACQVDTHSLKTKSVVGRICSLRLSMGENSLKKYFFYLGPSILVLVGDIQVNVYSKYVVVAELSKLTYVED